MLLTPVPLASFLLLHLSSIARPAALLGSLAIALVSGGIGGTIAALPNPSRWKAGGLAAGTIWFGFVFLRLLPPAYREPDIAFVALFSAALIMINQEYGRVPERRQFLVRTGTILGGAGALLALFSIRPLAFRAKNRLFAFRPPPGLAVTGITPIVTPNQHFYVMDKLLQYPAFGPESWSLTIEGALANPLRLNYSQLLQHRDVHRYVTLECVDNPVGGPLISTALWSGISLTALLVETGAWGDTLIFHGVDDYSESVPRMLAAESGALIAYGMNGEALPPAHGYPARLVLPGFYGFKNVKWLTGIEVRRGPFAGEWARRGWTAKARIRSTVRIDVAKRVGDEVTLAGVAFSGNRGTRAVEVRANRGPWRRADVGPILSEDTWVQWVIKWRGRGRATFEARAIDGQGNVQTQVAHGAYPAGATGYDSRTV